MYRIYTDGGYSMKNQEGASAYIIFRDKQEVKRYAFKIVKETSQRAELKAVIAAVQQIPSGESATIYTDSQYAINILSGKWNATKNIDLIDKYRSIASSLGEISFSWVKGHSGNIYNELCDRMCNEVVGYDLNEEYAPLKKDRPVALNVTARQIAADPESKLEEIRLFLAEVRDKFSTLIDDINNMQNHATD